MEVERCGALTGDQHFHETRIFHQRCAKFIIATARMESIVLLIHILDDRACSIRSIDSIIQQSAISSTLIIFTRALFSEIPSHSYSTFGLHKPNTWRTVRNSSPCVSLHASHGGKYLCAVPGRLHLLNFFCA